MERGMNTNKHTYIHTYLHTYIQLSGLEDALEYCELEEQFSTIPIKTNKGLGRYYYI